MAHCIVAEAEKILDREFKVLDKGFVRLVDYLGGDERIVQAARVSYGAGTKTFRQDRGLIHYLLKNDHTSPFEQVVLTFHAKMPIFVARQWIRHRTARINEISGRYSVMKDEFYLPGEKDVVFQSADNKQGRSDEPVPARLRSKVRKMFRDGQKKLYSQYRSLLDDNIARELARINLPLSLYTEWYWQIDLHNLFHFLRQRLDPHAQKEIRVYAEVMAGIVSAVCPIAYEAFEEHSVKSLRLSAEESHMVRELLKGKPVTAGEKAVRQLTGKLGFTPEKLETAR